MSTRPLPHDRYIGAVVDALTTDGIEPDDYWTSDANIDRYDSGPDAGCTTMLDAYIDWDTSPAHEHGIALLWEQPAEEWMWAPRAEEGHLARDPKFLPMLGRYATPNAVVAVVRALLAGTPLPKEHAPDWDEADEVRRAVAVWVAE
ncbi:hypothetical protein DF268_08760 [Streptomyces sp. V2]|uniref:hypothetical protein n=1 Tax=Streptomyces sp. V2 TaxID=1424099 RepID=UPI000D66D558|nr:hypothetical protein [Streptomyces sp. V2]PWG13945.1 hypothetical protein DF268_08760 [Streptomyces sp. V2]